MDTKTYFRKIRALEQQIEGRDAVVVSLETATGGKGGVVMEAPRYLACKLVVEDKARFATPEEASRFQSEKRAAYLTALGQTEPEGGSPKVPSGNPGRGAKASGRPTK